MIAFKVVLISIKNLDNDFLIILHYYYYYYYFDARSFSTLFFGQGSKAM